MGQGVGQSAEHPVRFSLDSGIRDPFAPTTNPSEALLEYILPGVDTKALSQAVTLTAEYDELSPIAALRRVVRNNAEPFETGEVGKTSLIPTETRLSLQVFTGTYGEQIMKVTFVNPRQDIMITRYFTDTGNGWSYNADIPTGRMLTICENYTLQGVGSKESLPYILDRARRYASNMLNNTEPLHEMGEASGYLPYSEILRDLAQLRPFTPNSIYRFLAQHPKYKQYNLPPRLVPITLQTNGEAITLGEGNSPSYWGDIRFFITRSRNTRRYNLVIATIRSDRETSMRYLSVYCGYASGRENTLEGAFVTNAVAFSIPEDDKPGSLPTPADFKVSHFKEGNEELATFIASFFGINKPKATQEDIDRFLALVINPNNVSSQGSFT